MSNSTLAAPTRASGKKSSAPKASNPPAPEPTSDTQALLNPPPNADEKLVAETAAAQLKAIYEQHWRDMSTSGCQLFHFAEERLEGVGLGNLSAEQGDAFYLAAALVEGCIAIERTKRPNQSAIEQLESVLETLYSAATSYGSEQEGCEALATGIRAGIKRHRDPPQPPIRRMDEDQSTALSAIAVRASTLSCFLWDAHTTAEANGDSRGANDFLVAEGLAKFIGTIADEANGFNYIGGALDWADDGSEA